MYQTLICSTIIVLSILVNTNTQDLTFEEAIKRAAALAGDWPSQEVIFHEIAGRIKPDTIPDVEPGEVASNSTDAKWDGVMDKQILNQIWLDIEPLRPSFDNPMMFANTSLSEGIS
jgi:hypothetical protein